MSKGLTDDQKRQINDFRGTRSARQIAAMLDIRFKQIDNYLYRKIRVDDDPIAVRQPKPRPDPLPLAVARAILRHANDNRTSIAQAMNELLYAGELR